MTIVEGRPAIVLTCSDRDRLSGLIMAAGAASATSEFLRQELERAEIVPEQLAETLVAIGTHVRFIDHRSHKVSEGRLTFPNDVETSDAIRCFRRSAVPCWDSVPGRRSAGRMKAVRIAN